VGDGLEGVTGDRECKRTASDEEKDT